MQAEEKGRGEMEVDGIGLGARAAADKDTSSEPAALDFPPQPPGRTEKVPFATFCDLLEALSEEHRHARRVEILRDFREKYLTVSFFLFFFFLFSFSFSRERSTITTTKKKNSPSFLLQTLSLSLSLSKKN